MNYTRNDGLNIRTLNKEVVTLTVLSLLNFSKNVALVDSNFPMANEIYIVSTIIAIGKLEFAKATFICKSIYTFLQIKFVTSPFSFSFFTYNSCSITAIVSNLHIFKECNIWWKNVCVMLIFVLWYSFAIRPIMLFALDEDKCVCCFIHDELQRPIHHYWICQRNAILDIPSCSAANGRKAPNTCSPLSIRDTKIFNDFSKFNDIHPSSNSSIKSSWILTYKANVTYRIIQWLSWITMFGHEWGDSPLIFRDGTVTSDNY